MKNESHIKKHIKDARRYQRLSKIYHARFMMHLISGVCLLIPLLNIKSGNYFSLFIPAILFFGLSVWIKTKPKHAIIVALVAFIILIIFLDVEGGLSIITGLWWKIIILALLIRGLLSSDHDIKRASQGESS